jgi:Uma2 family endonuclease
MKGIMASAVQIPVQEYLNGSFDLEPDAEYVDGAIEERPKGEWDHTTWQQAIELWFVQHRLQWNIRVRVEQRVQTSPTRFRIPDVVVVSRSLPTEQILMHAPVAVFEIVSPDDRMPRVLVKLEDYERMGIRSIFCGESADAEYLPVEGGALKPATAARYELAGHTAGFVDWPAIVELLD